ncbi:cytochrome b [Rubellimicrobium sp. CFH 75288]|uniref:cytochrome b n=1 Tax=Rubellimicrobium sp. CFH 75288 TaxID=2697034 RepID=UPI001411E0C6|nr:cytochrome b/b6 domain-containing protein [Rubellimicrobium sp. CFH 75288]NAZ37454.1 cytochrome b [Rubellimicrobium sp. CFH 75288]
MAQTDTPYRAKKHGYSSTQIALHWTVAILVVANALIGDAMANVFRASLRGEEVTNWGPAYMHAAIGLVILLVMIARLAARLNRPVEVAPDSPHRLLKVLATINHWAFYALLLAIPVLGAVAWFGGVAAAGDLHRLLIWVFWVLVLIHVGAALLHHFVLRDGLIRRMIRPTGGT